MKEFRTVMNSDQTNRNGDIYPASLLESTLSQAFNKGVPVLMSHDAHRLQGWSFPQFLHFQPGMTRLCGSIYLPENREESDNLKKNYQQRLYTNKVLRIDKHDADLLFDKISSRIKISKEECKFQDLNSTAALSPNILWSLFPDLKNQHDKHGLVPWTSLNYIGDGLFERDGFVIYSSHFFRRSLSRLNSLNSELLDLLNDLYTKHGLIPRVKLDPDLIGLNKNVSSPLELEYWGGPKFPNSFQDLKIGVTIHKADETERDFHQIDQTQFWWKRSDDFWEFECEELIDSALGQELNLYGCRYAHSLVDRRSNTIIHVDGAIREYNEDIYLQRLDCRIDKCVDAKSYHKLWRIDGTIPVEIWKSLVSHHFRNNGLVREYLNVKKEKDLTEKIVHKDAVDSQIFEEYFPAAIHNKDHIEMAISYAPLDSYPYEIPTALSTHVIPEGNKKAISIDGLNYLKFLKQNNIEVNSEPFDYLSFQDQYIELPALLLPSQSLLSPAIKSIENFIQVIEVPVALALTVGLKSDDRWTFVSLYGVKDSLLKMLPFLGYNKFQNDRGEWINDLAREMKVLFCNPHEYLSIGKVSSHGWFRIKRHLVPNKWLKIHDDEEAIHFKLQFPKSKSELSKVFQENRIGFAPCLAFTQLLCPECKSDYTYCSHIESEALLHNESQGSFAGLFWLHHINCHSTVSTENPKE